MPAAILYDSDGYDTTQPRLMGRHAAGAAFLRAWARHAQSAVLHCYAPTRSQFEDFERRVGAYAPARGVHWIPRGALAALSEPGAVHFPGPEIGELAWHRRHVEPRTYSITGGTHTVASHKGMTAIGDLLLAPVEPWDAVVCTSRAVRAALEQIIADWSEYLAARCGSAPALHAQLPVIPLGVDCEAMGDQSGTGMTRAALRSRYGIGEHDVAFLFLGRLSYHAKANPLPMYVALERAARETGTRLHLILAGWFPNQDIRKAFADAADAVCPSVRIVHLDGREATVRQHIWCAADIFTSLVDNIQETFGLTPIEAMAHDLPTVVSEWNGYTETVRHEVDGFLIPTVMAGPGSGEDLALRYLLGEDDYDHYVARASIAVAVHSEAAAAAYVRLVRNPALGRQMGAAGRRRAREVYDWRVVIGQYEDLWEHLAECRGAAAEACPRRPGAPAHPLRADPFRVFAAYPSSALVERTRVYACSSATLAELRSLCRLRAVSVVLHGAGTAAECDALLRSVAQADGVELGRLLARFPAERRALLHRALVWLAKLGLVRCVAPPADGLEDEQQQMCGFAEQPSTTESDFSGVFGHPAR